MKRILAVALVADAVALATVMLGSWTRIHGAGLTCPDWPLCHGQILPSLADGTLWEWTHRLLASLVAPLVIALVVVAWPQRRRSPFVGPTLWTILLLFCAQVALGMATVRLANTPFSVVIHWAVAMALIAALSAMAVFAATFGQTAPPPSAAAPGSAYVTAALAVTAGIAFLTMCIGAYVSSSGAGLACLSIPGCAGNVVVYTAGQYVQMLHRIAAAAALISAAGSLALAWSLPASNRVRAATVAGVALISLQVLLGLLNVALRLPVDLREAHAVNAALTFLAFFLGTVFATLDSMAATVPSGLNVRGASR